MFFWSDGALLGSGERTVIDRFFEPIVNAGTRLFRRRRLVDLGRVFSQNDSEITNEIACHLFSDRCRHSDWVTSVRQARVSSMWCATKGIRMPATVWITFYEGQDSKGRDRAYLVRDPLYMVLLRTPCEFPLAWFLGRGLAS